MVKKIDISTPTYPNTFTFVDDEDYNRIMKVGKWGCNSHGYVIRSFPIKNKGSTIVQLSRFILSNYEDIDGKEVDHIDHDKLDNRKSNLRACTGTENKRNYQKKNIKCTSKYKGVYWFAKKFNSNITYNNLQIYLGCSDNEEKVAAIYNYAATQLFKEFAYLNEIKYQLDINEKNEIDLRIKSKMQGIRFRTKTKKKRKPLSYQREELLPIIEDLIQNFSFNIPNDLIIVELRKEKKPAQYKSVVIVDDEFKIDLAL